MSFVSPHSGSTSFINNLSLDEKVFGKKEIQRSKAVEVRTAGASNVIIEEDLGFQKEGLQRVVGLLGGMSIIVGTVIGSGIFISPTSIISRTESIGLSLVVWFLCGVIAILGSFCYVELGLLVPKSGGEYAYLYEAFGPIGGFLYSWTSVLVLKPASLSAICLAFAIYCLPPDRFDDDEDLTPYLKLLAASAIVLITAVNSISVRLATRVQIIFTVAKMVAIVMLIITGLVRLGQGYTDNFRNSFEGSSTNPGKIGYAFYAGLWAYDGWNNLNYVTEEIKNPKKNLPRSIFLGISLVTFCYVLVNIAYFSVLNKEDMLTSEAVATSLAEQLYGTWYWVIPMFVAFSTFGAANGSAFSGGRLIYAAARNGHLPKLLCMIQKKRRTPITAMFFNGILSLLMLIPDSSSFDTLIGYFSFSAWLFYGATFASLIWLRIRKPDEPRPFKVWLIVPITVFLASLYLVIAPYSDTPEECTACLLFILAGAPVYLLFCKYKKVPDCCFSCFDKLTSFLERVLGLVLPPELQDMEESDDSSDAEIKKPLE